MAQVVEGLPIKSEALSSNPSIEKKKTNTFRETVVLLGRVSWLPPPPPAFSWGLAGSRHHTLPHYHHPWRLGQG
jgi:hypothetical protein